MSAIGAIKAIHEQGLRVPQDISVLGFDDIPGAAFYTPSLTTVRQPLEESGRAAMERLLQQLDKPTTVREVALRLELVLRGTG